MNTLLVVTPRPVNDSLMIGVALDRGGGQGVGISWETIEAMDRLVVRWAENEGTSIVLNGR